jgi:hypothetical protein
MITQQLRRWSDNVDTRLLRRWSDKANDGLATVYSKARNSPQATAAVVLATGVAAALVWLANRNFFSRRRASTVRRERAPRGSASRRRRPSRPE